MGEPQNAHSILLAQRLMRIKNSAYGFIYFV